MHKTEIFSISLMATFVNLLCNRETFTLKNMSCGYFYVLSTYVFYNWGYTDSNKLKISTFFFSETGSGKLK